MGGVGLQLGRQVEIVADQDHCAGRHRVSLRDVLEQAHVDRLVEVRVEVAEHVNPSDPHPDRLEHLGGLGVEALRPTEIHVDATHALGHSPLEDRHRGMVAARARSDERARPVLVARLDNHNGDAASEQGGEFASRVAAYGLGL